MNDKPYTLSFTRRLAILFMECDLVAVASSSRGADKSATFIVRHYITKLQSQYISRYLFLFEFKMYKYMANIRVIIQPRAVEPPLENHPRPN